MEREADIICPKCGRRYHTEDDLKTLWISSRFCVTEGCGYNLSEFGDDEEVWMDWFGDGRIDGRRM